LLVDRFPLADAAPLEPELNNRGVVGMPGGKLGEKPSGGRYLLKQSSTGVTLGRAPIADGVFGAALSELGDCGPLRVGEAAKSAELNLEAVAAGRVARGPRGP
jgi:hypothetical protein